MYLSPVDDKDIIRTIQHLKNKMSTDCSDIKINIIKNNYFPNCKII